MGVVQQSSRVNHKSFRRLGVPWQRQRIPLLWCRYSTWPIWTGNLVEWDIIPLSWKATWLCRALCTWIDSDSNKSQLWSRCSFASFLRCFGMDLLCTVYQWLYLTTKFTGFYGSIGSMGNGRRQLPDIWTIRLSIRSWYQAWKHRCQYPQYHRGWWEWPLYQELRCHHGGWNWWSLWCGLVGITHGKQHPKNVTCGGLIEMNSILQESTCLSQMQTKLLENTILYMSPSLLVWLIHPTLAALLIPCPRLLSLLEILWVRKSY